MTVGYLQKQVSLKGLLAQDSLVRRLITRDPVHGDKLSYWQLVFLQSTANGCFYHGRDLPHNIWAWPKHTWFQERLHLKDMELAARVARN